MIELYLGMSAGGWAVDGRTQAWAAHDDAALALAHWARAIAQGHATRWRRAKVMLWLSGGLARPFTCGPVDGLTSWAEAQAFAAAAAPDATGFDGPCRVLFEDWPDAAPTLVTAIEQSLADAVDMLPRTVRIDWLGVRPRWAAALGDVLRRRPEARIFALAEDDALTLLGGPAGAAGASSPVGHFDQAVTYWPAPTTEQATALWHRTMLSQDVLADDAFFARLGSVDGAPADAGSPAANTRAAWPSIAGGIAGDDA